MAKKLNTKPVYLPGLPEKLKAVLVGLRMRLLPRPVLVVGPYAGEFGIEIIKFQSFVRWLAPRYKEVHVITYPGREPLYRMPNTTVHEHGFDLKTAGYWYGKRSFQSLDEFARRFAEENGIRNYDLLNTNLLCTGWHRRLLWRQKHVPLCAAANGFQYDVVFHFRAMEKDGPDQSRNYRPELAEKLVRRCVQAGMRCACIGLPEYALCFEGCEDRRTEKLDETVSVIGSATVVVGELSGPIHLAVYCARPVVTWAPEPHRMAYAKKHNPFGVDIVAVSDTTTNPAPEDVFDVLHSHMGRRVAE
ncbi:MAG: hypothetical protein K9M45_11065 [Kiritimatiellales bacterium]|nr:hypothetical protein [Kiritimatiellales bacterium]